MQISSDEESQGGTSLKATRLKVPPLLFDRLRLLWLRFSFVNWLSSYKKSKIDSAFFNFADFNMHRFLFHRKENKKWHHLDLVEISIKVIRKEYFYHLSIRKCLVTSCAYRSWFVGLFLTLNYVSYNNFLAKTSTVHFYNILANRFILFKYSN